MATTNSQRRAWIAELVEIKARTHALNARRRELGEHLGNGTHRSSEFPGLKVLVTPGSEGWAISWKAIAETLASELGVSLERYVFGNRRRTHRTPCVSVTRDTARAENPKLKRA